MAKINVNIPEPTPQYTSENQRQIAQAIRTVKDQLNTTFQEELRQEVERQTWYLSRGGC
jgi:hypothetical protein